ncbi:MAG: helix-turn-helix domain-containing protein, partial [Xanthobacteraceae bacterium]
DLAKILGVQRTTVNFAVGQLERAGAIASGRGRVRIADRSILERSSCECYGRLRSYVAKLFAVAVVNETAAARPPAENFQVRAS